MDEMERCRKIYRGDILKFMEFFDFIRKYFLVLADEVQIYEVMRLPGSVLWFLLMCELEGDVFEKLMIFWNHYFFLESIGLRNMIVTSSTIYYYQHPGHPLLQQPQQHSATTLRSYCSYPHSSSERAINRFRRKAHGTDTRNY